MGRFDGVLLISDFDNTLVYTEKALKAGGDVPQLLPCNREALERFIAQGGTFAVATGRALPAFAKYAPHVPMNAPCVVCNGAGMYDFATQTYIEYALLEETALARGQTLLEQFPDVAVEVYHIGDEIHAVQSNAITRHHEVLTMVTTIPCDSLLDVPLPLGKLLFEGPHEDLRAIEKQLHESGWAEDYELIFSGHHLFEMTAKGATKGAMVTKLAGRLGIDMAHVYCVGDEANDLSMLAVSAQAFAPANAIGAVKDCGATVVCHSADGAIAQVVSALEARYPL